MAIDERGVARKHEMMRRDNVWKWWQNVPGFSQSYEGTIVDNGHTIIGKGKLSKAGVSWQQELDLTESGWRKPWRFCARHACLYALVSKKFVTEWLES